MTLHPLNPFPVMNQRVLGKLGCTVFYPQLPLLNKINWPTSAIWNTNWPAFKAILHYLSVPETHKAMMRDLKSISGSEESSEFSFIFLYFSSSFYCIFYLHVCILLCSTFPKGCLLVSYHDVWNIAWLPVEIFSQVTEQFYLFKIFLVLFIGNVLVFGVKLTYTETEICPLSFKVHK